MLKDNIKEILKREYRMIHMLRDISYELKLAFQRFWRGYDDSMWYNMDYAFTDLYISLLTELRDNSRGYPMGYDSEKWNEELEKMIFLLKRISTLRDNIEVDQEILDEVKDQFFKLFSKNFFKLWD